MTRDKMRQAGIVCCFSFIVAVTIFVFIYMGRLEDESRGLRACIAELEEANVCLEEIRSSYECSSACDSLRGDLEECRLRSKAYKEQAEQCVDDKLRPRVNR